MREKHNASPFSAQVSRDVTRYIRRIVSTWRLQTIVCILGDLSHLSITSNGLLTEETIENALYVLPYQFQPEFDSDGPGNLIGWGVTRTHTHVIHTHVFFRPRNAMFSLSNT